MPISTARRKELTRVRNPMQGAVAGDAGDVPAGARRQWSSMFRAGFRMTRITNCFLCCLRGEACAVWECKAKSGSPQSDICVNPLFVSSVQ